MEAISRFGGAAHRGHSISLPQASKIPFNFTCSHLNTHSSIFTSKPIHHTCKNNANPFISISIQFIRVETDSVKVNVKMDQLVFRY